MINRRNSTSRWRGLRIAGRMGLALFGGGVFAILAWNPRSPPATDHEGESTDSNHTAPPRNSSTVDPASLGRDDRAAKRWNGDGAVLMNEATDQPLAAGIALLDSKKRPGSKHKAIAGTNQIEASQRLMGMTSDENNVVTAISDQNPRGPPEPL